MASETAPLSAAPAGSTITVTLNGTAQTLPVGLTVAGLLEHLGVAPTGVAVERNRRVVRRADHTSVALSDGDAIEIVRFVGGG